MKIRVTLLSILFMIVTQILVNLTCVMCTAIFGNRHQPPIFSTKYEGLENGSLQRKLTTPLYL